MAWRKETVVNQLEMACSECWLHLFNLVEVRAAPEHTEIPPSHSGQKDRPCPAPEPMRAEECQVSRSAPTKTCRNSS